MVQLPLWRLEDQGVVDAVSERKSVLLRLDPAAHDALARWANEELRSTNAQRSTSCCAGH